MAISVADNFSYKGAKPLDARIQYATVANMKSATTSDLYDGCLAYVTETKKNYQYDSSNTTDPTTGKWRELQTGGGGGGSYTAGDGIVIDNDEISTDNASSEDIPEIVLPLPSVMSRRFKYSTEEQIIGEWIDGKPLYQKTVDCGALPDATEKSVAHGISNVKRIISFSGSAFRSSDSENIPVPTVYANNNLTSLVKLSADATNVKMRTTGNQSAYSESYVTLQYTKTTD